MLFQYHMPTQIYNGPLSAYADAFDGYGRRALIVTGRSSAQNGALSDVLFILSSLKVEAVIFDSVEENPSVENVMEATQAGQLHAADYVIGIGGGSPLDAAKAVALLLNHPNVQDPEQALYTSGAFPLGAKPMLAVPTTAGTGSEVTPFSILTRHSHHTKASIPHLVFPQKAFLNPAYTASMPDRLSLYTAIDALSHLVEGYLSSRATLLTDRMAEGGISAFGLLREALTARQFDASMREMLLTVSTLAGMVITQTKTTLPHLMGYALTYHKNLPHGAACGALLAEYMRYWRETNDDLSGSKEKTGRILTLLGLSDVDDLKDWLKDLLNVNISINEDEIDGYTQGLFLSPERLTTHPLRTGVVTSETLTRIYTKSLL